MAVVAEVFALVVELGDGDVAVVAEALDVFQAQRSDAVDGAAIVLSIAALARSGWRATGEATDTVGSQPLRAGALVLSGPGNEAL